MFNNMKLFIGTFHCVSVRCKITYLYVFLAGSCNLPLGECAVRILCRKLLCREVQDLAHVHVAEQGFKIKSIGLQLSGINHYPLLASEEN